jgi:signal transduction histidine kinase
VSLEGAILAVVGVDDAACEPLCAALRAAGATAKSALINANALATLSTPGFDAAVLDVGDDPERFLALATAMRNDPRTQGMPLIALASPGLACRRLAGLGPVHVVPHARAKRESGRDEVLAAGGLSQLTQALSDAVAHRRAASGAADYARALEERLRIALERLSALRSDAQTLTHDARVLCGVVVGFAANLRDGIAGPLDTTQRGHVAQILEAANDTAALVERFGGAARAHTELPSETLSPPSRRTARRTLLDLVELTRATLQLFETVAEQKSVTVEFDAPEPVSLWGDGMQVKQVVTNLLVNALKFTPTGGRVVVIVRTAAPQGQAAGAAARHHAELVVRDTGPGIPAEERERVFERGVRLARDERVPGSGIGLAVVREIVAMHGGTVRAEGAAGGGAALVARLPLDMRSRREQSVLLIDDPDRARRIVEEVRARRNWSREALKADERGIAASLEPCRAVVVVPSGQRATLDELLNPSSSPPAARLDGADG